jgi:hypothetical protein
MLKLEVKCKMETEATTAELAEIFGVTRKTICTWAKLGLMEKSSYGKYRLKESLRNFAEYMRIVSEGRNIYAWQFEHIEGRFADGRAIPFDEAEEQPPVDLENVTLVDLPPLQEFEVELDDEGRVKRVIGPT